MKAIPNRFWFIVILLGWVFDFLFWEKPLGVNFAIYISLCVLTGILLLRSDGLRLSRGAGLLLLPIAFLAAMTFLRLEPMTVFLSISMVVFLMGIFALTYLSGQWTRYAALDYIFGYLRLFGSMIVRPLGFAAGNRRELSSTTTNEKPASQIWPVLRGLVIALPVIAIFASLLASADLIFAQRLEEFVDLFNIENLPEYIFRLVYILLFAYVLAGTYLHAAQKSDEPVEEKSFLPAFLGFTEAAIVLGSVVALFIAFVAIQFQYFFGGQLNINLDGYTFSEYARKGFGELVTVAFFSLLMLLGLGAITRRETDSRRRIFSALGIVLVGLVIVMLVSAYQRLILYEAAYGFSRLRTYTHVFMIWLGLLLIAVAILEMTRRERMAAFAMVSASLGFIVSLNLLNVDAFIVRQNLHREIRAANDAAFASGPADLDAQYFIDLSDDAIPVLVDAFLDPALPEDVREKTGAALACKRFEREQDDAASDPWQSFHFARYHADLALAKIDQQLNVYIVQNRDWPNVVITPGGEDFPCVQYYYD